MTNPGFVKLPDPNEKLLELKTKAKLEVDTAKRLLAEAVTISYRADYTRGELSTWQEVILVIDELLEK